MFFLFFFFKRIKSIQQSLQFDIYVAFIAHYKLFSCKLYLYMSKIIHQKVVFINKTENNMAEIDRHTQLYGFLDEATKNYF